MHSIRPSATGQRNDSQTGWSIAMIGLAVLALHLLFGIGLALSPPVRRAPDATRPLILLSELPSPITVLSNSDFVEGDLIYAPLPHPSMPVLPASPPDTGGVVSDAAEADAALVARVCNAWPGKRSHPQDDQREASVLVRVDADGRVSDSELLVSTGSADRDVALRHCLLRFARLTPISVEGRPVSAWQRLHPPHGESSRRP